MLIIIFFITTVIFIADNFILIMCNGNKILHLFLYNPHILDSGWITQSIHKTRKGAERSLEEHKNELMKEWEERYKSPDDQAKHPFGSCEDWRICEFELLD